MTLLALKNNINEMQLSFLLLLFQVWNIDIKAENIESSSSKLLSFLFVIN
jgi:hypothetical protein